ncbi:SHOCT domain-containing protein [Natrinema salinisoli]|uniref:SHOCT domain-containing protein n=1 Tax=Natrinema salinisoli TaxID=2878535 RepID=UPI001CEFB9F7|nr:SHOCT domain-containing protein [Natrinema salinisoli]
MGRLSSVLLKGLGVLVLAGIVLSVVGTIVGIALSIVAAVLSMIVSLAILCVFVLAVIGLVSVLDSGSTTEDETDAPRHSTDETDPEEHLRSRYVAGELTDAEFERELERLLSSDERRGRTGPNRSGTRDGVSDRHRLRDR